MAWDEAPEECGLPRDRDARPGLDEVLALRADTQTVVRRVVEDLTDARLDTVPETLDGSPWPPPVGTVRLCLCLSGCWTKIGRAHV